MEIDELQKREVFHLSFLRELTRAVPPTSFAVKGGCNLRFFFGSIRYSEDIDIDVWDVPVHVLRDKVLAILDSSTLLDTLRTFGVERIEPSDPARAKQTETVQRFKLRLVSSAGEILPTRIEFSRREHDAEVRSEPVSTSVLSEYRIAPLIVPHYEARAATRQKIEALATRREPQARDVFDLYMLGTRMEESSSHELATAIGSDHLSEARGRVYDLSFAQYRDTVVAFLEPQDRPAYDSHEFWDEIRLRVVSLIDAVTNAAG